MKTTHLLLAIFLLVLFNAQSQTLPTEGLVGYFPFNGNANDESGNAHHGTVHGATLTTDRFGNSNSAYYFNGVDSYIVLPENIITGKDSVFEISFWYKAENDSGWLFTERCEDNPHPLLYASYKYDPGTLQQAPYIYLDFHGYTLYTSASNDSVYEWYSDRLGTTMQKNKWVYYAHWYSTQNNDKVIYLSNHIPYYQNYKGMKALYFGRDTSTKPLFQYLKTTNSFKGIIDDIRIYNRMMTPEEYRLNSDTTQNTNNVELKSNNSNFDIKVNGSNLQVSTKDLQIFNLEIFNASGTKVWENNNASKYNIENLYSGVYVLSIKNKDLKTTYSGKIIINQ
jgi:hypothetical protein